MARGKHSVIAARHQVEARDSVIDRLTDDLAEAKRRARQAEEVARRLEGVERLLHERDNDELVAKLVKRLSESQKEADRGLDLKRRALRDVQRIVHDDLQYPGQTTSVDRADVFKRRYPDFTLHFFGLGIGDVVGRKRLSPPNRRLSKEETERLQTILGIRSVTVSPDGRQTPTVDFVVDVLDGLEAGLTAAEIQEVLEP